MKFLFAIFLSVFIGLLSAQAADPIEGVWKKSDGQATIRLSVVKGKLVGHILDVKKKSHVLDGKNKNPALRSRKIIGLPLVYGFTKNGKEWEGGQVYDPSNGKTYKGKIWMEGKDKLTMRGFVGVSLLGRSVDWSRVK